MSCALHAHKGNSAHLYRYRTRINMKNEYMVIQNNSEGHRDRMANFSAKNITSSESSEIVTQKIKRTLRPSPKDCPPTRLCPDPPEPPRASRRNPGPGRASRMTWFWTSLGSDPGLQLRLQMGRTMVINPIIWDITPTTIITYQLLKSALSSHCLKGWVFHEHWCFFFGGGWISMKVA